MKIVGLTGGIGSGKSVILEVFSSYGVPCYQSDNRAKELMQKSPELIRQIKVLFGEDIYKDKKLNRSKLADIVLVKGNPAENIEVLGKRENILMVLKEGKIYVDRSAGNDVKPFPTDYREWKVMD